MIDCFVSFNFSPETRKYIKGNLIIPERDYLAPGQV